MILIIIICSEIPRPHIFQIAVQGNTQTTHLKEFYRETPRLHIFKTVVKGNIKRTQMCRKRPGVHIFKIDEQETPRVYIFKTDVQGNTQWMQLSY